MVKNSASPKRPFFFFFFRNNKKDWNGKRKKRIGERRKDSKGKVRGEQNRGEKKAKEGKKENEDRNTIGIR